VSGFLLPELRRTPRWRVLALVVSALTLSAQGAAVPAAHAVPVETANASPGSGTPAGVTVTVRDSTLGMILVDGKGRTLYLFQADKGTNSTCYGACATAWPPLTTTGKPQAGSGASLALLGTTARTDHTTQVTYDGHPLYYFVKDTKPGDVTGQRLNSFGAKWYVLDPKGNKIDKE
jgi:predicted lipoprotein with Yx(FWY)xxD motif